MNTKYKDLIEQTFDFPQEEFHINKDNLLFHKVDMISLVKQYGTPFKIYVPS